MYHTPVRLNLTMARDLHSQLVLGMTLNCPHRVIFQQYTGANMVRNVGVHVDSDVIMRAHVTLTVRMCFAALRQLRSVRRSLRRQALLTLTRALVISRVDYCSSVLAGAPRRELDRLQSVLNAAARLIFSARTNDHISPLLRELHWLRVPERIRFRLCVLAFRCLHGSAPAYLADSLQRPPDVDARRRLRSADSLTLTLPTTRRRTIGDRAFPVAASRAWNQLPSVIRDSLTLLTFSVHWRTTALQLAVCR